MKKADNHGGHSEHGEKAWIYGRLLDGPMVEIDKIPEPGAFAVTAVPPGDLLRGMFAVVNLLSRFQSARRGLRVYPHDHQRFFMLQPWDFDRGSVRPARQRYAVR